VTHEEATQALLAEVLPLVVAAGYDPNTSLTLDNEVFNPPDTSWVRVSVQHKTAKQVSMGHVGNRRYDFSGVVVVSSFVPIGGGTKPATALFESLWVLASTFPQPQLEWGVPKLNEGTREDMWFVSRFELPFKYENIN